MKLSFRFLISFTVLLSSINLLKAQDYSSDVELIDQTGSQATFETGVAVAKAKEAEDLAVRSTFNALLTVGVEGLNNGMPMMATSDKAYLYRFFNSKRYEQMLVGKPVKLNSSKHNKMRVNAYQVTIDINKLLKDLNSNDIALNHAWAQPSKEKPNSSIRPVIIVIPESRGENSDFITLKENMQKNPAIKAGVDKVTQSFSENNYETRDFITALENSQTDDLLRQGTQTDLRTMVVQQLPGDIVVKVDVDVTTSGGVSQCVVNVRAVEKQSETILASQSFSSPKYRTTDNVALATYAVEQMKDDFFTQLQNAFDKMAKEGVKMNLDMTLSESVTDWDFDTESPVTGDEFKEELEEWLRENSFGGIYNMSQTTDKYIHATLNLPLWDYSKNRSYRTSNFTSALRKFLKQQLGDEYKINIASLGQKLSIIIE